MINIIKKYQEFMKHPLDWFGHAVLIFGLTLFLGWQIGLAVAITIELTQIESGIWQGWDHLIDMAFNALGILVALILG